MQTFLPYDSFKLSARCLDNKRLGKQRVECLQLLRALLEGNSRWLTHPAAKMWEGYEGALLVYGAAICLEWDRRGFQDSCLEKMNEVVGYHSVRPLTLPPWLGNEEFHRSHQSNLVRKLPGHYRQFFPDVPDNLPYVWPV